MTVRAAAVAVRILTAVLVAGTVLGPAWPAAATPAAPAAPPAPTGPATLVVGAQTLHRCTLEGAAAWCGTLAVPLDYTDTAAGTITVGFGWRPATGTARDGTVVAQEGGPGYPSTGTTADYVDLFGSLLTTRNLLVVDQRGTGRSTPIACPALQRGVDTTTDQRYLDAAAACGAQLNRTFPRAGGGFVHASDLFTTANGARDLAAVLASLQQGPVDLYGDSYGTYFAQSFLARYPARVRSVVLDSAYEARDLDPWYVTSVTTARAAFQASCDRTPFCQLYGTEKVWPRIARLLASLRHAPVTGTAPALDGSLQPTTVDVTALVDMVNDAGYDFGPYRDLYAAAGAWLDQQDPRPLLRLWRQDLGWDYSTSPVGYYSQGQYQAVSCSDYPQLFDLHSSLPDRRTQLAASVAALPARTFAPFTTAEWLQLSPNVQPYTACLTWPAPTHPADPPVPVGTPLNPRHVPVLILGGDLDSLTPAAGGAHVAAQMGAGARAVVVPNTNHLVGLADPYGCGRSLVQQFLADPAGLATQSTTCAAHVPTVGTVAAFPRTLAASPLAVGQGSDTLRGLAWVAVSTAIDVAHRNGYLDDGTDRGLRGGRTSVASGITTLTGVRWVDDVVVDGTVDSGAVIGNATLRLTPTGGRAHSCTIAFYRYAPLPVSSIVCDGKQFGGPSS